MKTLRSKSTFEFKGSYVIRRFKALPAWIPNWLKFRMHKLGLTKELGRSPLIENLIVLNQDNGLNLFMQHLFGDDFYPLELDNASIGTGTTDPASDDTDLETPVTTGILRATGELTDIDTLVTEWFISNDELPNGTYTEFALKCGTQLFCRSIISPSHTKSDNEDTLMEYTIVASNGADES